MPHKTKAASFESFIEAPSRLSARKGNKSAKSASPNTKNAKPHSSSNRHASATITPSGKEKVGLTIDSEILEAIDDYIYSEKKQGHRLKKNEVYEIALRRFLGLDEGGA